MEKLYRIIAAVQLLLCALVAGCSSPAFDDAETVSVVIPRSLPEAQTGTWKLVCADSFGDCRETELQALDAALATFARNSPAAILAYPLAADKSPLGQPLGAIYPFSTELDERNGFAASVLCSLYNPADGIYSAEIAENIRHFNWPKFMELCASYDDPWLIQEERIKEAIRKGRFKKTDIKIDVKKD